MQILNLIKKITKSLLNIPYQLLNRIKASFKKTQSKNIFIHIGMPKTGSSAIQAFLALNTDFLAENDFCFPNHPGFRQAFQTSAGNVPLMKNWIKNKNLNVFNNLIHSCEQKNIILSSEILFSVLKNWPKEFSDYLKTYNFKLICYIRRIDELTESCINQQIKNHNLTNYSQYKKIAFNHDYYSCLMNSLDFFEKNNLLIRVYEKNLFYNKNIFEDFLKLINLKINSSVKYPEKIVNPSLNKASLEFRRLLNFLKIDTKDVQLKYKINGELAKYSVANQQKMNSVTNILSVEQKKMLLSDYSQSEQDFKKAFNGFENTTIFNSIVENKGDEINGFTLSKQDVKEILVFIQNQDRQLNQQIMEHILNTKNHNIQTKILLLSVQEIIANTERSK